MGAYVPAAWRQIVRLPLRVRCRCAPLYLSVLLVFFLTLSTLLYLMTYDEDSSLFTSAWDTLDNLSTAHAEGQQSRLFQIRTVPLEPAVHYRDAYDPMPPRDGEHFITFEEYLDCVAARLNVDRRAKVEHPFLESERTSQWPYLMVPATAELRDVKGLMCNMSVCIRHLLYVQNFDVPAASAFFDDLQREFNFTRRLQIKRVADNIGFAGSVNMGIRDALTYPFHEVPFYFLTNNDMRFGPGLLETMVPKFYEVTKGDEAVIKTLEAEVATEPNEYTPRATRGPVLRSSGEDTYLVTSRLLPDRIRYASPVDQRHAFSQYYGGLFLERGAGTSAWGQSRLALETVGLWDENFYPAYIEDTDYRFRSQRLGFKDCLPPFGTGGFLHYTSVTLKTGAGNIPDYIMGRQSGLSDTELRTFVMSQKSFYRGLSRVIHADLNDPYAFYKWGGKHKETARGPYLYRTSAIPEGVVTLLPLDCWVWGVRRREAISVATRLTLNHFTSHPNRSTDEPLLSFLPRADAASLEESMKVPSALVLQQTYMDGDQLRRLPTKPFFSFLVM